MKLDSANDDRKISKYTPSVVVSHYNQGKSLQRLLECLTQQEPIREMEILVCDDGSADPPSTRWLRSQLHAFPNIAGVVLSQEHRSNRVARSRNNGIKAAQGNYVIFLDADMLVARDFITQHLATAAEGVISCGTRTDLVCRGDLTLNVGEIDEKLSDERVRDAAAYRQEAMVSSRNPWRACIGANFGAAKSDRLKFNELFIGRAPEDLELAYRLCRRHGYHVRVNRRTCGLHVKSLETHSRWREIDHAGIVDILRNASYMKDLHPEIDVDEVFGALREFRIDSVTKKWRRSTQQEMLERRQKASTVMNEAREWFERATWSKARASHEVDKQAKRGG